MFLALGEVADTCVCRHGPAPSRGKDLKRGTLPRSFFFYAKKLPVFSLGVAVTGGACYRAHCPRCTLCGNVSVFFAHFSYLRPASAPIGLSNDVPTMPLANTDIFGGLYAFKKLVVEAIARSDSACLFWCRSHGCRACQGSHCLARQT